MRTTYMASAGLTRLAASSGNGSQTGRFRTGRAGEKAVQQPVLAKPGTESDDYGLAFMQKHQLQRVKALESAFRKLASLSGKQGGLDQMLSPTPIQARVPTACATRPVASNAIEIIAAGAF